MAGLPTNLLYFGDNLYWLRDRDRFPDASVDLVYLDPPFNSNRQAARERRREGVQGRLG
jgi:16S rRNA G966 N2-methylase RsmD